MNIVLYQVRPAGRVTIRAVGDIKGCPLLDFFGAQRERAPKELAKLTALLSRVATHDVPKNQEKCRPLGDGLFEFKADSLRVIWFWCDGRVIICTHGLVKKQKKTPPGEIDRAKAVRKAYEAAKQAGTLTLKGETP